MYLEKQWNIYSAKWRVPKKHQRFFGGRKHLKKSLKTGDRKEAQALAYQQVSLWRQQAEQGNLWQRQLEQMPADGEMVDISESPDRVMLKPFNRQEHVLDVLTGVLPDHEVDAIVASDDYRSTVSKEIIALQQYLEPFLKRLTTTPKTIDQKRRDVGGFIKVFPYVHMVSRKALREWLEQQDKATPTIKRALSGIKQFWHFVEIEEDITLEDPFRNLSVIGSRASVEKRAFTRVELERAFNGLKKDDHRLLFNILALTGLRVEEACSATYENGMISVLRGKTKAATRTLPLHSSLDAEAIREWQKTLVAGDFGRKSHNIAKGLNRKLKRLGFGNETTVHSIRRYVATQLERNNVQPLLISRILGHSVPGQTLGNYSAGQEAGAMREALEALESLA